MIIAQLPSDEELRLQSLKSLEILDTPAEKEFDDIVELASYVCNVPVSLITLLDRDRQWFKSKKGIEMEATEREYAFCSHAILQDEIFEVKDTLTDQRFVDNPLVNADPAIRFYAGTPIYSPGGYKLGTICVLDSTPNELNPQQRAALLTLANQITKLIELRNVNRLIKNRAEDLLQLTTEATTKNVLQQESQQRFISNQLHENMAQVLAACRMYLGLAVQNESMRLPFIETVNNQLGELIGSMRTLSASLTPAAFSNLPVEDMFREFLSRNVFPFIVTFNAEGDSNEVQPELRIACTRVLEKWLEVLEDKNQVQAVKVDMTIGKNIQITMEHDGPLETFSTIEKDLLKSSVYNRVQSKGGTIKLDIQTKNCIEVVLPLSEPDPENADEMTARV
jgi:hypothetical protein